MDIGIVDWIQGLGGFIGVCAVLYLGIKFADSQEFGWFGGLVTLVAVGAFIYFAFLI